MGVSRARVRMVLAADRRDTHRDTERQMALPKDFTWQPSTEERWNEMLGVLPPCYWVGDLFLVGEAWNHTDEGLPTFAAYNKVDGQYVRGSRPITIPEAKGIQAGRDMGFGCYAEEEARRVGGEI